MRHVSLLLIAFAAVSGQAFAHGEHKHGKSGECCPVDAAKEAVKAAEKELVAAKKSGDKAAIEAAQKKLAEARKAAGTAAKGHEHTKQEKKDKSSK